MYIRTETHVISQVRSARRNVGVQTILILLHSCYNIIYFGQLTGSPSLVKCRTTERNLRSIDLLSDQFILSMVISVGRELTRMSDVSPLIGDAAVRNLCIR